MRAYERARRMIRRCRNEGKQAFLAAGNLVRQMWLDARVLFRFHTRSISPSVNTP
jgi:hypothetical protein